MADTKQRGRSRSPSPDSRRHSGHRRRDSYDYSDSYRDYSDSFVSDTESEISRRRRKTKPKTITNTKKTPKGKGKKDGRTSKTSPRQQLDNVTRRVLSARRIKLNELRNEVEDLNSKLTDLRVENKTLRRQQHRSERALEKFEGAENELPTILQKHSEELRTLREQLRRHKEKSRKAENRLRDCEDDLSHARKQMKKYKNLAESKNLGERDDLSRRLTKVEADYDDKDKKVKELERYVDNLTKNHKHQLGVEAARHKDTQRQLLDLKEQNDKLHTQLKEKEKELEVRNIYANRLIRPPHKLSANSSMSTPLPNTRLRERKNSEPSITPREKAKLYEQKRRDEQKAERETKSHRPRPTPRPKKAASSPATASQTKQQSTNPVFLTDQEHSLNNSEHNEWAPSVQAHTNQRQERELEIPENRNNPGVSQYKVTRPKDSATFDDSLDFEPYVPSGVKSKVYVAEKNKNTNKPVIYKRHGVSFFDTPAGNHGNNSVPTNAAAPHRSHDNTMETGYHSNRTSFTAPDSDVHFSFPPKPRRVERDRREKERLDHEYEAERQRKAAQEQRDEEERRKRDEERRLQEEQEMEEQRWMQREREKVKRENEDKQRRQQEENERRQRLDREERERREREDRERDQHERQEREERERREMEAERQRRAEEERKRLEQDEAEQERRRQKDILLAKMKEIDSQKQKKPKGETFIASPTSSKKEYNFAQTIENMHHGKPAHEDVKVPVLENKRRRGFWDDDDSAGYQPSFASKDTKKPKSRNNSFINDDLTPKNASAGKKGKQKMNLMEELFGSSPQTDSHSKTKQNKNNDSLFNPSDDSHKKQSSQRENSSMLFGGGAALVEDIDTTSNKDSSTLLPRRSRQPTTTIHARPTVNAVDDFDDEIEEVII